MDLFVRMLSATVVAPWISTSFPIIRNIIVCIMAVCAIAIIVVVLMQTSTSGGGNNAISGATESYYAENRAESKAGRLKKITVICAITIPVLTVLYFISTLIYNG